MENQYEQQIVKLKTEEAIKKNYFGLNGKFGLILQFLGQPIIEHIEGLLDEDFFYSSNQLNIYSDLNDDSEIKIKKINVYDVYGDLIQEPFDNSRGEDYSFYETGIMFDALTIGANIQITFLKDENELTVIYDGNIVYKEVDNKLKSFISNKIWEEKIDKYYKFALEKQKKYINNNKILQEEKNKNIKNTFIKNMKNLFGI